MSIISNRHSVVNYDAKKSSAFEGQRLSKITYKTDKETGNKKESKCVSLPVVTNEMLQGDNLTALSSCIRDFLSDAQDKIIRARVDSGATDIADNEIDAIAIAAFMAEESTGSRLTKETIGVWFTGSIADSLMIALGDKLGVSDNATPEDIARIELAMAQYKDKLCGLAGGKTSYSPEIATRLLKALDYASEGDELASKFSARLTKMIEAPAMVDIMLSL